MFFFQYKHPAAVHTTASATANHLATMSPVLYNSKRRKYFPFSAQYGNLFQYRAEYQVNGAHSHLYKRGAWLMKRPKQKHIYIISMIILYILFYGYLAVMTSRFYALAQEKQRSQQEGSSVSAPASPDF
jgi:hypothetical protein